MPLSARSGRLLMFNQKCYCPWSLLFSSYHLVYVCRSTQFSRIEQFGGIRPYIVFSSIPQLSGAFFPLDFLPVFILT